MPRSAPARRTHQPGWFPSRAACRLLIGVFVLAAALPGAAGTFSAAASDAPNDGGKAIRVTWQAPAEAATSGVAQYEILVAESPEGPFRVVATVLSTLTFHDADVPADRTPYYFKVRAAGGGGGPTLESNTAGPARARAQWYHRGKTAVLIGCLVFAGLLLTFIRMAQRGRKFFIRPIGGIEAIDEAIGRATEMGKPILFVPGLFEAGDVPTLAAFSILGRVARRVAEYQTRLIVPCYYPMVMVVAQEVVKQAYLAAGRPEAYREEDVFYNTSEQFAYTAAINGIMLREKPATNFYLGAFYAESLVLAETGYLAGSIQIAGTDQTIQIPFFIAACDYTLIGEELYAAAAYLSEDPMQIGSLKAQDYGKLLEIVILTVGVVLMTLAAVFHRPGLEAFKGLFEISF